MLAALTVGAVIGFLAAHCIAWRDDSIGAYLPCPERYDCFALSYLNEAHI
jgi:hypothetical protein